MKWLKFEVDEQELEDIIHDFRILKDDSDDWRLRADYDFWYNLFKNLK